MRESNNILSKASAPSSRRQALTFVVSVAAALAVAACQHTSSNAINPSVIFGGKKSKGGEGGGN